MKWQVTIEKNQVTKYLVVECPTFEKAHATGQMMARAYNSTFIKVVAV